MAYHTIGRLQKRHYSASQHSSATAAVVPVSNRSQLLEVFQTVKVNQTATAGSWTVSLNGTQITGLSSGAVPTGAVGDSTAATTAAPSSPTILKRGDVLSVVGSSLTASEFTFVVQEF